MITKANDLCKRVKKVIKRNNDERRAKGRRRGSREQFFKANHSLKKGKR